MAGPAGSQRHGRKYVVVHWRRGDQLKSRCVATGDGETSGLEGRDKSINCGSATSLSEQINNVLKFGSDAPGLFKRSVDGDSYNFMKDPNPIIYIATNQNLWEMEGDMTIKDIFRREGFKVFK